MINLRADPVLLTDYVLVKINNFTLKHYLIDQVPEEINKFNPCKDKKEVQHEVKF